MPDKNDDRTEYVEMSKDDVHMIESKTTTRIIKGDQDADDIRRLMVASEHMAQFIPKTVQSVEAVDIYIRENGVPKVTSLDEIQEIAREHVLLKHTDEDLAKRDEEMIGILKEAGAEELSGLMTRFGRVVRELGEHITSLILCSHILSDRVLSDDDVRRWESRERMRSELVGEGLPEEIADMLMSLSTEDPASEDGGDTLPDVNDSAGGRLN